MSGTHPRALMRKSGWMAAAAAPPAPAIGMRAGGSSPLQADPPAARARYRRSTGGGLRGPYSR